MKHDRINTNGINLHYVAEGEGNLMLFLHGFPECWYSWRKQLPEFAKDHHAVALDLRGYNESDKPSESSAYKMSELVADVKGAIEGLGYQRCTLVGHDWGGAIAWNFAYEYPEMLDRLIILNLPHPAKFSQGLRTLQQLLKSWYVFLFQIPYLPEFLIQFDDYKLLETALKGMAVNQEVFSAEDINFYKDAFAKRGAATAAINYYRNIFQAGILEKKWGILEVPTLMIWGEKDIALGKELTYGTEEYVRNLQIRYIPNCSHWVQQEQPNLVNQYIREFIGL